MFPRSPTRPETLSLCVGLLALGLLWLGPLPEMSRTAFSPHMMLHLGLITLAAPLISFGLRGMLGSIAVFRDAFSWALLAAFCEMVVVWGWHVPLLHALAARNDPWFVAQQVSFLVAGMGVWSVAFAASSRAAAGVSAMAMAMTFMHMSMFGLLITLAPTLVYAPDLCRGAFGMTSLEDQQFGGILMAVLGGIPYVLGVAYCTIRLVGTNPQVESVAKAIR